MLVYVMHQQRLFSLTLPLHVYGSYSVSDIDDNNKERMLITIDAVDGKWVAHSNKNVSICKDGKMFPTIELENYQYLLLQIKGIDGYLVMYTCPVNDNSWKGVIVNQEIEFSVGRDSSNAISCNNPLIEKNHTKFIYRGNCWIIQDLNTNYGTYVNNRLIHGEVQLFHGDVIFILGLKFIVLNNIVYFNNPLGSVMYDKTIFKDMPVRDKLPIIEVSDEDKYIELYEEKDYFIRSPRFMEVIEEVPFNIDAHPNLPEPDDTPAILTIGPMVTMGMTSMATLFSAYMSYQNNQNIFSILPTCLMAFSMLAGTLLWPSISKKYAAKALEKKQKDMEFKYIKYLQKKEKELMEISTLQRQVLLSNYIGPSDCYQLIMNKNKSLWKRELHQNDFLSVRLGIGKVPLRINCHYPEEHFELKNDNLSEQMKMVLERHKYIDGAPIIESLVQKNILAITGKYEFIKNYMDILMLQFITFHSYYDLKIVLLTDKTKEEGWEYLKQMPHVFRSDKEMRFFATDFDEAKEVTQYLLNILNSRREKTNKNYNSKNDIYKEFSTYYLVITDDYDTAKNHLFIEELCKEDINYGFSLVILNTTLANLPTGCKSFIGLNDMVNGGIFESELRKDTQRMFKIEPVQNLDLKKCSIILNNIPIKNKEEEFNLPKTYGFLEMYDAGNIEQLNSLERWQRNNPINSLAVGVGLNTNGSIFKLDLHEKEQGPHGLIAGMTGSGKSEFIITYILSLAINFHPHEVQFVLIDYKGGGLVGAFENSETGVKLPHLAGTITNLDTAEINRALASIESELKRRQALFNEAREKLNEGTLDIYKYQKYYREGLLDTPLSHLFIISDEFAELKSQRPEFMDQLISTARIGRSLGVHLILATQKPSGVVNDQIWSNARFKVCLKVQDASDSNEVIKRPDAANLKDVGRFYLQVGYDEYFAMGQSAYSGVSYIPRDKVYHDIDDKINFINNVGKSIMTIDAPKNETLKAQGEELSNIVSYLNDLAKKENITIPQLWLEKLADVIYVDTIKKKYHFVKKDFQLDIVIGAYDNPKIQRQDLLAINLNTKGNAVIYSITDKSNIVHTILYSLITTYHTREVNIYIFDFDSQVLKIYQNAPQVGDVVFSNETEKVDNLLKTLLFEIEKRKELFQNYNGSYDFYCQNSGTTLPNIVLLLFGYENFKEAYEDEDTLLAKIAREGSKYGIHIILTAISDRSLRLNTRSSFPQVIPLKMASEIDYNLILGKKAPVISDVEGRGVVLVDDEVYEFQTASICESDQRNNFIKQLIDKLNQQIPEKAPRIRILPSVVGWNDVLLKPITLDKIPVGLEVDSLNVAYFDPTKSLFTMFNSNDISILTTFSLTIIKKLLEVKTFKTVVCDTKKLYSNEVVSTDFASLNDMIFMANRDFPLLVFITGLEKWISQIPTDIKNDLINYFNKINDLHNCYFVIVDRIEELKSFAYEKWFKQFTSSEYGVYIGRGISNSVLHNLTTPFKVLNEVIPDNFGYNISKANAIRIKIVEGEKNG